MNYAERLAEFKRAVTYAERLAEFKRATGHLPGEMNKIQQEVSLEPPAQSAGPGRCNLKYCGKQCVLADGHAGAHEL